jgi:hypothetical protein
MNWLALLTALAKLAGAIGAALRDRRLIAAGEAKGRAASDSDHARTAAERGGKMREIAALPPARQDVDKRLEEGNA